ncbi:hypothetical protein MASR1M45_21670 [Candidatus Kapaibacterium sp.]
MPINRRLPKFGFFNRFRVEYQTVNLSRIQELIDNNSITNNVDFDTLLNLGVIKKRDLPLKILGNGEIKSAVSISAHSFSSTAKEKIESVGGTVTINE